ncbi:MAG: hypothetical protein OJF59_003005 [Cytophagales bacterium]|nr:MAG: hypothetical protein OJF59_003005 [Cytophagales bacterium]
MIQMRSFRSMVLVRSMKISLTDLYERKQTEFRSIDSIFQF